MMIDIALLDMPLGEAPVSLWVLEKENTVEVKQNETTRGLERSLFTRHILVVNLFEMKTFRDYVS